MSHLSKVELEIKDLDCLKKSISKIEGMQFVDAKTFKTYYTHHGDNVQHKITVENCSYEIGIKTNGKSCELLCDYWSSGGLTENHTNLIKQKYAVEKTRKEVKAKYPTCSIIEKTVEGNIQLTCEV